MDAMTPLPLEEAELVLVVIELDPVLVVVDEAEALEEDPELEVEDAEAPEADVEDAEVPEAEVEVEDELAKGLSPEVPEAMTELISDPA